MKNVNVIGLAAAVVMALTMASQAAVLYDVAFAGDTPGTQPPTGAPVAGGTSTHVQWVNPSSGSASLHAWVQSSMTDPVTTNTFGTGSALELMDQDAVSGYASARLVLDDSDKVSTTSSNKIAVITWDMMLFNPSSGSNSGKLYLNLRTAASGGTLLAQLSFSASSGSVGFYTPVDSGAADPLSLGTSYSIKVELNYEASTMRYFVNGAEQEAVNINPALEFGSADWTTGTTSVLRVGVDNLKIETLEVPEPGSIGLMIFGGFAVLLSRRIAR